MNNEEMPKISYLVMIAGRKEKDALLSALSDHGAKVVNTLYGRGSVKATYLMSMLGCVAEENKTVIMCLLRDEKLGGVLDMLLEEFNFKSPNTGIAFTVPVDGLSY